MSYLFSETEESPRGAWAFAGGVVVGAAVVALVWALTTLVSPGATGGSDRNRAAAPDDSARPRPAGVAAEPCHAVHDIQTPALRAATTALQDWRVHVDTMNAFAADEITREKANEDWDRTRHHATEDLAAYDEAAAAYAARTTRCPTPTGATTGTAGTADAVDASGPADASVTACRAAVSARNLTLRAADAALATWREHVLQMEMLRDGTMTGDTAAKLWEKSWKVGSAQLKAYDEAAQRSAATTC
ncbi:hypothetical protein [Nocardioides iriomotensis]|uniref:Uncharacterized protein n=1 Tax=Nocardioides iriomotensis TaxID=715784 RepID=A0A4Q5IVG9_9ACTN|nr:hypothetical protein [Nocardioides iriomotensis]RYU09944.1 hypothetical protein ETU37_19100 [Nocardioides iriomotensis]